ncbi:MAG TPA: hypothetical protein ENK57_13895, partial [Polyangiaceae bacterium]|nr:hypothetical protein [Polyangiaceae bacterium]
MADPTRHPIDRLAELARTRDGVVDATHDERERARFLENLKRPAPELRAWRPLALAAAIVVAASVTLWAWPRPALDYELVGGTVAEAGYVHADGDDAELRFSDGSTVTFDAGSAGRIVEVSAEGAELLLERGHATVSVTPLDDARWSVAAGPYAVRVTGTRFDVAWAPNDDRFELSLQEGSVEIRGPLLDGPLSVTAGKRVVARVRERDVSLSDLGDPVASEQAPAPTASASATASEPDLTASPTSKPAPPISKPKSWASLVAEGDYDTVLAQAEARGIASVMQSSSAGDLVALGDAARYRGRGDVARQCLVALREHHAGHPAAVSAAFLLGRMSEGSPSSAIGWYDRYLSEAPGGAYAAEALGRKLALVAKSNPTAARAIAKQYLAAYPRGAYAE